MYAKRVELGYVPRVVFSEKDWRKHVPARSRKEAAGSWATADAGAGVIYVNLARACCRRNTDDTCAHEVLHLHRPDLRHGKAFDHHVSELLLGRIP